MEIPSFSVEQLVGQQLEDYQIRELLAKRTLSTIYIAHQQATERPALLTVFLVPAAFSPEARSRFRERFLSQAAQLMQLDHPNILPLYSYGEKYGYPFLITPPPPTRSLAQIVQQDGSFSPDRTLELLKSVAAALDAAHQHGVIHGSLNASNVLLDIKQNVLITGFSLRQILTLHGIEENDRPYAHLLDLNGSFLGAPEYMAPELVEGAASDARSDMYALGMLMYQMLSGSVPFSGDDPLAVAFQHVEEPIPALQTRFPSFTPALDLIVQRALESDPAQRYVTAGKLVAAYERVLGLVGRGKVAERELAAQKAEPARENLQERGSGSIPPVESGKLPVVDGNKASKPRRGLLSGTLSSFPISSSPQSPLAAPTLTDSEGWQLRPPIITNHMAAVKAPTSAQPALQAYPPLPEIAPLEGTGLLSGKLGYEAGKNLSPPNQPHLLDPETLILQSPASRRSADPDTLILPSATAEGTKNFWQQEAEPDKERIDPSSWLSTPSNMANVQPVPPTSSGTYVPIPSSPKETPRPLRVNKGRRSATVALATGIMLSVGGISLSRFLQKQPNASPPAAVPSSKTKTTPQAPAKTTMTATVIGKKSQPVNSALHFTNPSDQQDSLLVHLPNGNFVAYERACTHEQVLVNYDPQTHHFICPRHHAVFDPQAGAKVLSGPAPSPLKMVKIRLNADGSIVLA